MARTYAVLNSANKGSRITLSGSDLIATSSGSWSTAINNIGKTTGKWVFEGNFPVSFSNVMMGLASYSPEDTHIGSGIQWLPRLALWYNGYIVYDIATIGTPPTISANPVMCAVDSDAGKGWFCKDGVWANSGDPIAGTNPSFTFTPNSLLYAGVSSQSLTPMIINNGASAFTNTVPSGFNSGIYNDANPLHSIFNTRREL